MSFLELSREVTLISYADSIHDLLNTQKRRSQEVLSLLQPDELYVLHDR